MFSVIRQSKIWLTFSGVLVLTSIILTATWGLKLGIDFRGGSLAEIEFASPVSLDEIRTVLQNENFRSITIQPVSDRRVIFKAESLEGDRLQNFRNILSQQFGEHEEQRFESIGPAISRELLQRAYWQISLVILGILLYIAYAFRKISKTAKKFSIGSWKMGSAAIFALVHDLILTIGFFAILGKFFNVEVDSLFVTALLTILGFSIHDTIVVFDRIREYFQTYPYKSLSAIIDHSINSTLARSINTTSTLVFVLIAMLLFGGQTIFYFVLALTVGVIAGTYSSIFVATPLLYYYAKK